MRDEWRRRGFLAPDLLGGFVITESDEFRVAQMSVDGRDGTTRDLVGADTRQWKRCRLPIVGTLRDLIDGTD